MQQYLAQPILNQLVGILYLQGNNINSISDITGDLQSLNSEQKSSETIENEAKLYEKLREMMSTKEFVKQYDAGLSYD